jgi:hypothetical protein
LSDLDHFTFQARAGGSQKRSCDIREDLWKKSWYGPKKTEDVFETAEVGKACEDVRKRLRKTDEEDSGREVCAEEDTGSAVRIEEMRTGAMGRGTF